MNNREKRALFWFLIGEGLCVSGLVVLSLAERSVPLVETLAPLFGALVSLAGAWVVLFASYACRRELRGQSVQIFVSSVWVLSWLGLAFVFYFIGALYYHTGHGFGIGLGGSVPGPGTELLVPAGVTFWLATATVFIGWPVAVLAAR